MSMNSVEAEDLAVIPTSALVLNMGTLTDDTLQHYKTALAAYNAAGRPTLLDPVGAGATAVRRRAVRELLDAGHFHVIKGNEAEIRTVWAQGAGNHVAVPEEGAEEVKQHGVDSGNRALDEKSAAKLVRDLASRERSVVVMTGQTDFLSDGRRSKYSSAESRNGLYADLRSSFFDPKRNPVAGQRDGKWMQLGSCHCFLPGRG